jgi:hypothetical protein
VIRRMTRLEVVREGGCRHIFYYEPTMSVVWVSSNAKLAQFLRDFLVGYGNGAIFQPW